MKQESILANATYGLESFLNHMCNTPLNSRKKTQSLEIEFKMCFCIFFGGGVFRRLVERGTD